MAKIDPTRSSAPIHQEPSPNTKKKSETSSPFFLHDKDHNLTLKGRQITPVSPDPRINSIAKNKI